MPTRVAKVQNATFVNSNKPTTEFLVTARDRLRLDSGEGYVFLRFANPIPAGEQEVTVVLEVTAEEDWPSSRTLTAQRVAEPGRPYREINWNNKPAAAGGSTAVPVTQAGTIRKWQFTMTGQIPAGAKHIDFRIITTDTTVRWLKGVRVTNGFPRLVIQTQVVPEAPVDVTPDGIVGVHAPVVQWTEQEGTDQVQVQVGTLDVNGDWATTEFDTGALSSDVGRVDLRDYLGDPDVELVANGEFTTNATGWAAVTNAAIARSTAQFAVTPASLALTASAGGDMRAGTTTGTGGFPVKAGITYAGNAKARAAVTSRQVNEELRFYDAAGAQIGASSSGTAVADSNANFNAAPTVTAQAPALAVTGAVVHRVASAAAAEVHYVDSVSVRATGGLTNGATKAIRARHHVAAGWSAYSEPVQITRQAKPVVTITNPGSTTADATPPVTWTSTGQKSWQVIVEMADEGVVANSKKRAGADLTWTPPDAGGDPGDTITYTVRTWDNVDRAASPGDPAYSEAVKTSVYTPTASVAATTTVTVTQVGDGPGLQVAYTRAAGIPDEIIVVRDGKRVHRQDGTDSPWVDYEATPNVDHVYGVIAVVNNQNASGMATATAAAEVEGVWLIDEATTRGFCLSGLDLTLVYGEESQVLTPMRAAKRVRRTSALLGAEGVFTGQLDPRVGRDIDEMIEDLWWMRGRPYDTFRLIMGDLNIPVNVNNLFTVFDAESSTTDEIVHNASFAFEQNGELPFEAI